MSASMEHSMAHSRPEPQVGNRQQKRVLRQQKRVLRQQTPVLRQQTPVLRQPGLRSRRRLCERVYGWLMAYASTLTVHAVHSRPEPGDGSVTV
jgi:hypothetical protein